MLFLYLRRKTDLSQPAIFLAFIAFHNEGCIQEIASFSAMSFTLIMTQLRLATMELEVVGLTCLGFQTYLLASSIAFCPLVSSHI